MLGDTNTESEEEQLVPLSVTDTLTQSGKLEDMTALCAVGSLTAKAGSHW
jgi:hypothetical protein